MDNIDSTISSVNTPVPELSTTVPVLPTSVCYLSDQVGKTTNPGPSVVDLMIFREVVDAVLTAKGL